MIVSSIFIKQFHTEIAFFSYFHKESRFIFDSKNIILWAIGHHVYVGVKFLSIVNTE